MLLPLVAAACGGTHSDTARIFAGPSAPSDASCSASDPCSLTAAIAAERAVAAKSRDVVVYLHGGTYRLAHTIRLGAADSGRRGHRVVWRNYPGEAPILSGGVPLRGWHPTKNGRLWSAAAHGLTFLQLYAGDTRLARPRSRTVLGELYRVAGTDTIHVRVPEATLGRWQLSHLRRAQVVVQYVYRQLRYPIASISADEHGYRLIATQEPVGAVILPGTLKGKHVRRIIGKYTTTHQTHPLKIVGGATSFPTYIENAPELMSQPGDWYLDHSTGRVKLLLAKGEDPNRLGIVAPKLQNLLVVDGASNLLFYGLAFEHSTWTRPATAGNLTRQGGVRFGATPAGRTTRGFPIWYVSPGAVVVQHSTGIAFVRDAWRSLGANGLVLGPGTQRVSIRSSAFDDIADTAVFIGSQQRPLGPVAERNVDTVVSGDYFHDLGEDYTAGSAISATYPQGLVVADNEIDDVPNIGINVGWVNNIAPDQPTVMRGVRIVGNHIARACTAAYDCGAIHVKASFTYGSGTPRSEIVGNVIENVNRPAVRSVAAIAALRSGRPLAAIYLDNYAGGLLVAHNAWLRCQRGIASAHAGKGNTLVANGSPATAGVSSAGLPAAGPDLKHIVATGAPIGGNGGPFALVATHAPA